MAEASPARPGDPVTPVTTTAEVALSAEARLQQLARQSDAPAGAAVVVGTEIAARLRGGVEWRTPDAVAVSVLARPHALEVSATDVGWAAAGLAAARALEACGLAPVMCLWPDEIVCEAAPNLDTVVSFACTLGPGRIEFAVLTARAGPVAPPERRAQLTEALLMHLRDAAAALEEPATILDDYRTRCATFDNPVEVRLLPHGATRGTATGLDDSGRLMLTSPTGLVERIAVASIGEVNLLER